MKHLTRKLIRPVIGLGLLAGATAGATVTSAGTAGASPSPSITFVHEGYANGVLTEKVVGRGFTPGGSVWIGIAVDRWNSSTSKTSWDYQWGAWVTATKMGINYSGGDVSTTITVNNPVPCALGLAASDAATGAYTPPAAASQYGGSIPDSQVNNTSKIRYTYCVT